MPTTHYSGDGRTPRTNTILHPDEVDAAIRADTFGGGTTLVSAQVIAYKFEDSGDAFPNVSEAIYLNLTADQAVHLMARLAACLDEKAISTYFGTPAKVTIDLTDDGLEGS